MQNKLQILHFIMSTSHTTVQYRSKISEPLNAFPTQSQRVGVLNLTRLRLRVHANANAFSEAH